MQRTSKQSCNFLIEPPCQHRHSWQCRQACLQSTPRAASHPDLTSVLAQGRSVLPRKVDQVQLLDTEKSKGCQNVIGHAPAVCNAHSPLRDELAVSSWSWYVSHAHLQSAPIAQSSRLPQAVDQTRYSRVIQCIWQADRLQSDLRGCS